MGRPLGSKNKKPRISLTPEEKKRSTAAANQVPLLQLIDDDELDRQYAGKIIDVPDFDDVDKMFNQPVIHSIAPYRRFLDASWD